jgi:hypothetical protein
MQEHNPKPSRCLSLEKTEECCWPVAAVKYRSETYCWTKKLNREDYGVDKYWVFFILAG